jgi:radical SAM superfamily enzyme YgiQ (UPF0313 family)
MKKILLIYPPSPVMNREDRCQQPTKELLVIPPLPPSDLMYLAAVAEKAGLEAKIKDYSNTRHCEEPTATKQSHFEADLEEFQPDYLVVNIAAPTLESDLQTVKTAKEICPNVVTIAKGAAFLTFAKDIMQNHPALDIGIVGEAEETLREIVEEQLLHRIKGIYFRDDLVIKATGPRPFIEDLDSIPFPARHLVDNNLYRRPDNNKVQAVIKVSRGCPFHCFFCLATPVSGAKVRRRSVENIIAEIRKCVEKYKIKNFLFWSDIFNLDREWTIELCNAIIKSRLKITWSANTRADTADLELAKLMHKAGCRLVSIGVESGSSEMLEHMGKKITPEQVRATVKAFKKARIRIYNYFVIGLPWETAETAEETIRFAIELNSDFISFYTAMPLPGTRFYDYACANGLFDGQTSFENAYFYPAVNTHHLTKERVFELHKSAIRRYYLRPKYILMMLTRIRSFTEIKNYFTAGFRILFTK